MLVAGRADQYYEAKYYQDAQEYYSDKTLHRKNPPLSIDNYGYDEQYKCQQSRQEFHHSWRFKYKVSNKNADNQQLKDIKECFGNIFLLSFTKVHSSDFIIGSEVCQEKGGGDCFASLAMTHVGLSLRGVKRRSNLIAGAKT